MSPKPSRLSITEMRSQFCSLFRQSNSAGTFEITKRGRTIGLLLVGSRAASGRRGAVAPSGTFSGETLRQTVEIHGDIETGLRRVRARVWGQERG
jgi:hypothetical protein